ncbi:MAG: 4-hydroxythreonine-4-phosphate dehydrogenase PdxA [Pseudomonadales bacterium]|jgi:4-hydroxythreonine-4-phosphate dehydrogenase|nr:4-hydroxythreonine-4-phosphate dehydrogenase PdxA [Pseudomonadales bacterium]MDP7360665.1 4-hydroxythreonine-4-phosphate dehydrogenase PdxA [Pseudomonadales bacterium]MDP7597994.1 4-hydroxythreonine-4-phosphate dehydrogenase PdxA [Pseudomonadales bacterium]HJN52628.1 4-hydroxythreonine-4-phosphate dehydrogenase PdxA [Pseudomonadales bacterium]
MPRGSDRPKRRIRLALTAGEPAGIGPDLVIALHGSEQLRDLPLELIVVADPDLLKSRAQLLDTEIQLPEFDPAGGASAAGGPRLQILPVPLQRASQPGSVDQENAVYVMKTLESALDGCLDGHFDAMVTGPVHKAILNAAGFPFTGHTEWFANRLADRLASKPGATTRPIKPVMMLVTKGLRVALATTHLPLSQIPQTLSRELLLQVVRILHSDLRRWFGISVPRILVCGLNPHAGEGGYLGREEIEIITPALQQLRGEGMNLTGPIPADTAFTPHQLEAADVVLAMYHDQGLPVLKQMAFGASANITLGLPLIRTSVDHGTALDLAGKGVADLGSLLTAIRYAFSMVQTGGQPGAETGVQTEAAQAGEP